MFCILTYTGTVIFSAIYYGHVNSSHLRYGSPPTTVLADLLTRIPLILFLKNPFFGVALERRDID